MVNVAMGAVLPPGAASRRGIWMRNRVYGFGGYKDNEEAFDEENVYYSRSAKGVDKGERWVWGVCERDRYRGGGVLGIRLSSRLL